MEATRFDARVRERDGVAVVDFDGEIDAGADEAIERAYATAADGSSRTVLLNFADVDYINSTGIALIVGLLARARKERTRVLCAGLSEHYREIFEITRLADFMELYPDEESAVATGPAAGQRRGA
ncbi:MAG TPA: STAS domain-containing protein [Gaiellaceae bacterium]|jgi:anti-anti-sigma factor